MDAQLRICTRRLPPPARGSDIGQHCARARTENQEMTDKPEPPFPRSPEELVPIEPADFTFALQMASAAAALRMPMKSPSSYRLALEAEDGSVQRYRFSDTPTARAGFAVKEHFEGNPSLYVSTMMRIEALQTLRRHPEMQKWTKPVPGEEAAIFMHQAVFEAAATTPLNESMMFDPDTFFRRVGEIAADYEPPAAGNDE